MNILKWILNNSIDYNQQRDFIFEMMFVFSDTFYKEFDDIINHLRELEQVIHHRFKFNHDTIELYYMMKYQNKLLKMMSKELRMKEISLRGSSQD